MRRATLLAILTLTLLSAARPASAVDYPLTPDPADCVADPIDVDALIARADGVATPAAPTVGRTTRIAPLSTTSALMDAVIGSVACTNAKQPLRALSYFTEDYLLHRIGGEPAVTLGHLKAAATRDPDRAAVEDRVTIEVVENATVWDGGAEVVMLWSSGERRLVRTGLRFRDVGGEWKIDEVLGDTVDD